MADISLRKVTKRFKTVTAIDDLSLDIADGKFTVLLGPTGAGKTTTLRIVAGLEKPDRGEVWIDGRNAQGLEPEIEPLLDPEAPEPQDPVPQDER